MATSDFIMETIARQRTYVVSSHAVTDIDGFWKVRAEVCRNLFELAKRCGFWESTVHASIRLLDHVTNDVADVLLPGAVASASPIVRTQEFPGLRSFLQDPKVPMEQRSRSTYHTIATACLVICSKVLNTDAFIDTQSILRHSPFRNCWNSCKDVEVHERSILRYMNLQVILPTAYSIAEDVGLRVFSKDWSQAKSEVQSIAWQYIQSEQSITEVPSVAAERFLSTAFSTLLAERNDLKEAMTSLLHVRVKNVST